ncbi:TniQ family protein [Streptomyces sp. ISL-96]|uniref:TniQ family protein n=1 Tax=Streptomyces sp. ISL-96 TaxID=2819191 RepID=UPI001BE5A40A|nr:TniQ family protein [Streptomyces sp. ISL-96]MBT2491387.1 TniQ family protein [Streptomyces sp. ISL-96]
MTETLPGRLARLPVQVSPRLGEGTDSYIRRLARANHLKPSYLHGFLCGPPFWFGKPRLERLADVTGRTTANLQQALFDVSTPRLRYRTGPGRAARIAHRQPDLYTQLQNAARDEGLTVRELASRHGIPRWLIRNALASNRPLPRDLPARQAPVTRPIAPLIDSMLHAGLGPREIWTALMDQHNTSVSYGTLNLYISKRRRNSEWQSEHFRVQRKTVSC